MKDRPARRADPQNEALQLLCAGSRTVQEIAGQLGVSTTAARKRLYRLQRNGYVNVDTIAAGVGKPAHRYSISVAGEQFLSRAYLPFANALLDSVVDSVGREQARQILVNAGRQMSGQAAVSTGQLAERVGAAVEVLKSLGAVAELRILDGELRIECSCCAISGIVKEHPEACSMMQNFLASYIGAPVTEHCIRSPRPQCLMAVPIEG